MPNEYNKEELIQAIIDFYEEYETESETAYVKNGEVSCCGTIKNYFGSWGNFIDSADLPHNYIECSQCENLYSDLGNHWQHNPECLPEVTKKQHEILTGLMMGDGCAVRKKKRNTYITVSMITRKFLEWLDGEMGILGRGVVLDMTEEESARGARESGFSPNAKARNYNRKYKWNTRNHPEFNRYRDWYSTGQKRFPDDLELTPLILKVWYCCDGSLKKGEKSINPSMVITASNESDRVDFLLNLFDGLNVSPRWDSNEKDIVFRVDDTVKMSKYMEEGLPGFDYKWPPKEKNEAENSIWGEEEIEILRREYPQKSSNIEDLERSEEAIRMKAWKMGIRYEGK